MNLTGKTILVTGVGTTGFGEAVAQEIAKRGGGVVLSCNSDEAVIKRARGQAEELGGVPLFPCNLGNDESVALLAAELRSKGIKLDGTVHSVAYAPSSGLKKDDINGVTTEEMLETFRISAWSLQLLSRHLLGNTMSERVLANPASIVTMTFGLAVRRVVPNYHLMAVAKGALEVIARYEAVALAPEGVRVNIIDAGAFRSTALKGITGNGQMLKAADAAAPLGGVTREKLARVACHFLSDDSGSTTGSTYTVDGGVQLLADTSQRSE